MTRRLFKSAVSAVIMLAAAACATIAPNPDSPRNPFGLNELLVENFAVGQPRPEAIEAMDRLGIERYSRMATPERERGMLAPDGYRWSLWIASYHPDGLELRFDDNDRLIELVRIQKNGHPRTETVVPLREGVAE